MGLNVQEMTQKLKPAIVTAAQVRINVKITVRSRSGNILEIHILGIAHAKDTFSLYSAMLQAFFSLYCLLKNTLPPKVFFKFFKEQNLFFFHKFDGF